MDNNRCISRNRWPVLTWVMFSLFSFFRLNLYTLPIWIIGISDLYHNHVLLNQLNLLPLVLENLWWNYMQKDLECLLSLIISVKLWLHRVHSIWNQFLMLIWIIRLNNGNYSWCSWNVLKNKNHNIMRILNLYE